MTREMNTTHDYRQDAAKTVARRSELALLRLRNARTLAKLNEREIAGGGAASDEALMIETERALEMAQAALAEAAGADKHENENEKE